MRCLLGRTDRADTGQHPMPQGPRRPAQPSIRDSRDFSVLVEYESAVAQHQVVDAGPAEPKHRKRGLRCTRMVEVAGSAMLFADAADRARQEVRQIGVRFGGMPDAQARGESAGVPSWTVPAPGIEAVRDRYAIEDRNEAGHRNKAVLVRSRWVARHARRSDIDHSKTSSSSAGSSQS